LKKGHYSYECTASTQERPYKSRPSRTQQLLNPKLKPKLTTEVPEDLVRKKGVANEILKKKEEDRKRARSLSTSSADSVSTISTNRSPSRSRSPRRRKNDGHKSRGLDAQTKQAISVYEFAPVTGVSRGQEHTATNELVQPPWWARSPKNQVEVEVKVSAHEVTAWKREGKGTAEYEWEPEQKRKTRQEATSGSQLLSIKDSRPHGHVRRAQPAQRRLQRQMGRITTSKARTLAIPRQSRSQLESIFEAQSRCRTTVTQPTWGEEWGTRTCKESFRWPACCTER
jgi:ribosomal protein L34E